MALLDPEMQDGEPPELCSEEPGLAACYAAAERGVSVSGERAGQAPLRLVVSPHRAAAATGSDDSDPVAEVRGVNLHARQRVDGRDRRQLERLCHYRACRGKIAVRRAGRAGRASRRPRPRLAELAAPGAGFGRGGIFAVRFSWAPVTLALTLGTSLWFMERAGAMLE